MRHTGSDSSTTRQLLAACERGENDAFETLFGRYRRRILSFISGRLSHRLAPRVDASDIVQETQLILHERLAEFLARKHMPFSTWAIRTALDCLGKCRRTHVLAKKRTVLREIPLDSSPPGSLAHRSGRPPAEALTRKEMVRQVQEALERLPVRDRAILVMRYVQGLDNAQIAPLCNLTPNAVSKWHGRALIRLTRQVRRV